MLSVPWKNAATVIIFARNSLLKSSPSMESAASSKFDYKVLMLRRSGKSSFMPNLYVFPGGKSSTADFEPHWLTLFKDYRSPSDQKLNIDYVEAIKPSAKAKRPFLMSYRGLDGEDPTFNRDLAFRLCAVRETFEECGLFLHNRPNEVKIPTSELAEWRPQVCADANHFGAMCRNYRVIPDVTQLSEWSAWLTPVGRPELGVRRFDTIFYSLFLEDESLGGLSMDGKEISHLVWSDPETVLAEADSEKIELAPPQVYELTRMSKFGEMSALKKAVLSGQSNGVESMMPVIYACRDGVLSALPGDDLYPGEPDYEGRATGGVMPVLDKTIDELMKQCSNPHRAYRYKDTIKWHYVGP